MNRNTIQDIYDGINIKGKEQLRNAGIAEAGFDLIADPRRSLDMVYELPESCTCAIETKVTCPLKDLCQDMGVEEVIFPKEWLHMTLFSPFGVAAGKSDTFFVEGSSASSRMAPYHEVFKEAMSEERSFKIRFDRVIVAEGTPTKPGCIFVGGTPDDHEVESTRKRILALLENKGLEHSQIAIPNIFHVTVARWQHAIVPPKSERVISFVEQLDTRAIWAGKIEKAVFCSGGYILTTEKTSIFDEVTLS